MRSRRWLPSVAALALLAAMPLRADAAPVAVVTTPMAAFQPGAPDSLVPLEVSQGGTLAHLNFDPQAIIASSWGWHAIVADDLDDDGQPLFSSDLIGWGQTDTVDGVEALPPGTYAFHCQTHGDVMIGTLIVTPS